MRFSKLARCFLFSGLVGVFAVNLTYAQATSDKNKASSGFSKKAPEDQDSYLGNLSDQISIQGNDLNKIKSQIVEIQKKIDQNSRLISYLNSQLLQVQISGSNSLILKGSSSGPMSTETGAQSNGKSTKDVKSNVLNKKDFHMSTSQSSLYNHAYDLLNQNKYKDAIDAFNLFLSKYPKTNHANEIYYLLGQLYLITDNNDYAISSFKKVSEGSAKSPDAMLQIGRLYLLNGDAAHAKQFLEKVVKEYPKSSAAEHAKTWLKTM